MKTSAHTAYKSSILDKPHTCKFRIKLMSLAPEHILQNQATYEMIDVWACGILMYLIFSGNHPFKATNNFDLCKRILNDQVKFNGPEWKAVSTEAKSLIKGMLTKNPLKRLNLDELIEHPWIRKYCKPRTKPKFISTYSTKNLMLFNSERKLEQAL
jgi:serine/threonine protein kinase